MAICEPDTIQSPSVRWPVKVYMLVSGINQQEALNCGQIASSASLADLFEYMNKLKSIAFDLTTGKVDYVNLANCEDFYTYATATTMLRNFDLDSLRTVNEKKAFWINIYNILMIHGVIELEVVESIREIRGIFDRVAYIIGGLRFSLDDIENGILRANRGHVAMPGPRFSEYDPRIEYCLPQFDPRIHFALNCASTSCPPVNFYTSSNLDHQLDLAATNFINSGEVILDKDKMAVSLSRIFQWFGSDFGGNWLGIGSKRAVLDYISRFVIDNHDAAFLREHAHRLKVRYHKYDWSLNV